MLRQAKSLDWSAAAADEIVCRDQDHGRCEDRCARRISLSDVTGRRRLRDFPGATQIIRIERKRRDKASAPRTWSYYITDLPVVTTDAKRLGAIIRGHWMIENGEHYIRDVVYGEDRCRCRNGNLPEILALARSIGITYAAHHRMRHADVHRALGNDLRALSNLLGVWLAPGEPPHNNQRQKAG